VTSSADGMTLFRAGDVEHLLGERRDVERIAAGAGDTVVATVALALAARVAIEQAIALASIAAAISVSKRGTSTISPAELTSALGAMPG
jgi:D-beta-D-heptose 7-phosphate kinase/D-beta-D-heptose 1-phosphate adenosyltransferase